MEVTYLPSRRGWVKPKKGAEYAAVSLKVFYRWLRDGLRHVRLANNRILTQFDWIDSYLQGFEVTENDLHPNEKIEGHIRAMGKKGGGGR